VNDPPIANVDLVTTNENTPLSFAASALAANDLAGPPNESDQTLTVSSVAATDATHGTITLSDGTITYAPAENFSGASTFAYTVCDNGIAGESADPKCAAGFVYVTVTAVNRPP